MTADFRALCVELTDCLEKADWPHRYKVVFQQWMDIARAALAEPDGPAVSDNRIRSTTTMVNYITFLVSVVHPAYEMTINRYCVGVSLDDTRLRNFDIDHWAEPTNRQRILSLLCEDWLTENCAVVGFEQIAGAIQWENS